MPDATSTLAAPYSRFPTSQTMIGATSPLWTYFAGAALVGTAWWWMSRWSGLASAPPPSPAPQRLAATEPPAPEAPPVAVASATLIQAPPLPAVEAAAEPPPPAPKPRKPKDNQPKPH